MRTFKSYLKSFLILLGISFVFGCGSKIPPFDNCIVRCDRCAEGVAIEDLRLEDFQLYCTDSFGNEQSKSLSDLHLNACIPLDQFNDVVTYCRGLR